MGSGKFYLSLFFFCVIVATVWGESPQSAPAKKNKIKSIEMVVTARTPPDPALKYQLQRSWILGTKDNAAKFYRQAIDALPDKYKENSSQIDQYLQTPPTELSRNKVTAFLSPYKKTLQLVETGTRCKNVDWELSYQDGYSMTIPPLNKLRYIAKILAIKARLEISQGQFDQAIHAIQTGMTLGRHTSEGTLLIGSLVGMAIHNYMLDQVQAWIEQDGPNLYWALAGFHPVEIQETMTNEQEWFNIWYPAFQNATTKPLSQEEAEELLQDMMKLLSDEVVTFSSGKMDQKGKEILVKVIQSTEYCENAKNTLLARGYSYKTVNAMPANQVVVVSMWEDYVHWRDELYKWIELPYPQAQRGFFQSEKEFEAWLSVPGRRCNVFTILLLQPIRAYYLQAYLDRKKASLQTIEAIRVYYAKHNSLPKTLDQLVLPAPHDPVTGKPFEYHPKGDTFILIEPAPKCFPEKEDIHYEVRMKLAKVPPSL